MYKQILMPIVPAQNLANLQQSVNFLRKLGANHLHLVHVMSEGFANRRQLKNWLEDTAAKIKEQTACLVTWDLLSGHPATEICEAAEARDMDMIYQWASQRGILSRTLLGSTSSDVLRMTEKPAFIHKTKPSQEEDYQVNRILFATDFGEAANRATDYLKELSPLNSGLVLLHVRYRGGDPTTDSYRQQEAEEKMNELREELQPYFPALVFRIRLGATGRQIMEVSNQEEVELVVMGRYNQPSFIKGMGSTAENVVGRSQASVLVIP